jgi:hypothetical protein
LFGVSASASRKTLGRHIVDARLLRSLRWTLIVSGVLGVLWSAPMFLVTLVMFGHGGAVLFILDRLPAWALGGGAAPPAPVTMLIVGSLCALLLVIGKWPIKLCAALAVAWFVYAQAAFGPGGHWARQVEQTFDFTPLRVAALVSAIALLAVSVLALVMAARPTGVAQAALGDVARSRLS